MAPEASGTLCRKGRPKNTSRIYKLRLAAARLRRGRHGVPTFEPLPHWSEWDETMTRRFEEICGATMRRLGYETQ